MGEAIEIKEKEPRRFLTENDKIERFENNLVTLTLDGGTPIDSLEPRRLFPTSRPEEYITLLNKGGEEIAVIRGLSDIDSNSERVIRESLDNYYLVPKITKIYKISIKTGTIRWSVLTDRGRVDFYIHNRNDIKSFSDGTVRVRDSDDNRYVIENVSALDFDSRAKLLPHI